MNSESSQKKPYLIVISLDGFRWDYVERFNPPYLSDFIEKGVKTESLIPSYPSKTYPNHITIATGLYPDNHGIINNSFYDNEKKVTYKISNRKMVEDGTFYNGSPIWVQADKAQMVSASYFYVGTEADIQKRRPTYYYKYDGRVKNSERIVQTLKWLALPAQERPHLITLYFSDLDDRGHKFGPNNDKEIKKAVLDLDKNLGDIFKGVADTGLPVNIIFVSDHGMTEMKNTHYIPIEDIENESLFSLINNGTMVQVYPMNNTPIDSIYAFLKIRAVNFKVYKMKDTPGFEYKPKNKNWGAIQVIPDFGYYFSTQKNVEAGKNDPEKVSGTHGYDTKYKDMHGVFYANGPAFKSGLTVPAIKNIHIYPLMCKILELEIPDKIDGKIDQIKFVLKNDTD